MRRSWCASSFVWLVVVMAGCSDPNTSTPLPAPAAHYPITTVTVGPGTVEEILETFGTVELDPEHTTTLTAVRAGKIGSLKVVAGQIVKRAETLLVLAPVPAASLEVERAEIELDFANKDLERVRRMAKLKLATNQETQTAEKQVEASRAVLAALGLGGATPLRVVAPEDGVVAEILVAEGALVQAGQELARIAPVNSIAVRVGFEVEEIPRLSEGLMVQIKPVFNGPDDQPVSARLARLHRVADPATQLVEGLVRIDSPPAWAVAGTRARVRVVLQRATDVVRVPRSVLVSRSGVQASVFIVSQNEARLRSVEIGIDGGEWLEIRSGLQSGQQVVEAGRASLSDGAAVRVVN